jgi:mRNA-degrading endonuclease toxin of MazEF toxin-antitoxin module
VKRGEIWVWSRFGHEHKVLVVGEDGLTAQRQDVLVVPISDVLPPAVMMPHVVDLSGKPLGVATVARVGPVQKSSLTARAGVVGPEGAEIVDMNLRVALGL